MNYRSNNSVKAAQYFKERAKPSSAQSILKKVLQRHGIDKEIARYQFVLHWKEIVGDEIAKRASPECFRGKALIVRVSDSAWAQELSFQKRVILSRLKRYLRNDEIIDDVLFYVAGRTK